MVTDTALQFDVLQALKWEPSVSATRIGVAVKDGVVTLSGTVDTLGEKWSAERAVKGVRGVRGVANELDVELPGYCGRSDADIVESALNILQWDTSIPDESIQVTVEDGHLTLEGAVDWQYQRRRAEEAVANLMGIREVKNLITVKPAVVPADLEDRIEAALERCAGCDAEDITVETQGSKVILRGTVNSWAAATAAEEAVWSAPGVTELESELDILPEEE